MMAKEPGTEQDAISVELRWGSSDDLPTIFANQMVVSHAGGSELYLLFGELTPPLVPDLKDAFEKGHLPKVFEIKPVAKVALSPDAMTSISKALAENVAKYERGRGDSKDEP